jgi:dUTP pyrophosphatase
MKPAVVRVRLLGKTTLPERMTAGAAGFDLAASTEVGVPAHGYAVVGTGLALELPPGLEAQVRPRSGLAARSGIGILNSPGTIDSDYRGEIKVILFNCSDQDYTVRPGDRIAQLVFSLVVPVELKPADSLSDTERGPRGFGHTG